MSGLFSPAHYIEGTHTMGVTGKGKRARRKSRQFDAEIHRRVYGSGKAPTRRTAPATVLNQFGPAEI